MNDIDYDNSNNTKFKMKLQENLVIDLFAIKTLFCIDVGNFN